MYLFISCSLSIVIPSPELSIPLFFPYKFVCISFGSININPYALIIILSCIYSLTCPISSNGKPKYMVLLTGIQLSQHFSFSHLQQSLFFIIAILFEKFIYNIKL